MSSPVVKTSAGESLISKRPLAVAKWSAWLVSKNPPFSDAPSPVIPKSAKVPYPTLLPSSSYRRHTKDTMVTNTLCFQYCGKTKQRCRNVCIWSSGECNVWHVNRHELLDTTNYIYSSVT